MNKSIAVSFLLMFLFLQVAAGSPGHPNFSGVWKFNPKKSNLQIPPPTESTFKIEHSEPNLHLSRTHIYEGKSDTFTIDLTTDGKEVMKEEESMTVHGRLYWEGDQLVFDSLLALKDGRQGKNVVRYSLSGDTRTLTATESFRGPVVKYDNVWVFDRQ